MSDVATPKTFHDFGDGSFRTIQFWALKDDTSGEKTLYQAATILEWRDVGAVQEWATPEPEGPTPEEEKTLLWWRSGWIQVVSPYLDVAKAWQKYRTEKRRRKQITQFPKLGRN